ncbi:MAG: hypothetical protein HY028_01645 [Gammaproteobacteria bacterium]|nr:hypothetical protein [Gammaproteobacteria bacterium]
MRLECNCPGSFPGWHDQDINLAGQLVHTVSAPMFLHMPMGYELQVKRQQQTLERLNLTERWPGLVLMRTGLLRGKLLRLLEPATSPARGLEYLPNPFQVRGFLHEGGIGSLALSVRRMQSALVQSGKRPLELYLSHLTCPRCAAARGGEKILLLRHWVESPALLKRVNRKAR